MLAPPCLLGSMARRRAPSRAPTWESAKWPTARPSGSAPRAGAPLRLSDDYLMSVSRRFLGGSKRRSPYGKQGSRRTYFLGGCFEESPGTGHWTRPGPPRTGCHMTAFGVGEVKCEHKFTQPH